MKTKNLVLTTLLMVLFTGLHTETNAQDSRDLQYYRNPGKAGLNVFETPKTTDVTFDGVKIRMGGSNTLQFQGLSHENGGAEILDIGPNFNLATSNLDVDVQLEDGVRMHLRTYMSSRHHPEPYVKGGYMQVDRLDFISEGLFSDLMEKVTFKVGHMENNYGDVHFRRSDNGQALYNPFVGNYLMDSFTTEVGGEVYWQSNGLMFMLGMTNGKLNQSVVEPAEGNPKTKPSLLAKAAFDRQMNSDLRVRFSGSVYHTGESARNYLYTGDRAGSRYYSILTNNTGEFRTPRYNPNFANEVTAIMLNPFVKYQGLEFFGVMEFVSGKAVTEPDTRSVTHLGAEVIYRLGEDENYYVGGRYNLVTGDDPSGESVDITRINIGGGWFMTNYILAKAEFVTSSYDGFPAGNTFEDGSFSGVMIEAVISF